MGNLIDYTQNVGFPSAILDALWITWDLCNEPKIDSPVFEGGDSIMIRIWHENSDSILHNFKKMASSVAPPHTEIQPLPIKPFNFAIWPGIALQADTLTLAIQKIERVIFWKELQSVTSSVISC